MPRTLFAERSVESLKDFALHVGSETATFGGTGDYFVGEVFGGRRDEMVIGELVLREKLSDGLWAVVAFDFVVHESSAGVSVPRQRLFSSFRHFPENFSISSSKVTSQL